MSSQITPLDDAFLMKHRGAQDYTLDMSNWWFE